MLQRQIKNETPLAVKSPGFVSSASQTRPSNTTAYTALDVVGDAAGTVMTFANIGEMPGGHFIITGASLMASSNAVPSGMGNFNLHLYDTAITGTVDNLAFNLESGHRTSYLGYIVLNTPSDLGDTIFSNTDNVNFKRKLAASSTSLYGVLQTVNGFTPTANCQKTVVLNGIQC